VALPGLRGGGPLAALLVLVLVKVLLALAGRICTGSLSYLSIAFVCVVQLPSRRRHRAAGPAVSIRVPNLIQEPQRRRHQGRNQEPTAARLRVRLGE